jgi:transmembrane protein EpsG
MLPYILLYSVSFILSLYNYLKENTNKVIFCILMLCVGIFAGSRLNIGGYDYDVYELMYENTSQNFSDLISTDYFLLKTTEKGYILIMSVFRYLNADFNTFFLVCGIACSLGLFFVFKKYSKFPYLILTIFFAKGYLYYFFTAQRQIIAMVICWLAIKFVIERKLIKFLILIIAASFFHTSAVIFILAYPLFTVKITNKRVVILLGISLLIGLLKVGSALGMIISNYLPFGADKLTGYLDGEGSGVNVLNFIEIIPVLFILLNFRKKIEHQIKYFNIFFNLYLVYIMITFAFYDFAFIARLKGYFLIGYIIILSSLVYIPSKKNIGIGIISVLLMYCFASYIRELLVFDNGEGYLPYNSYLFNDF